MRNARLAAAAFLTACLIEMPFMLLGKFYGTRPVPFIVFTRWHIVPYKVLGWVDSLHPLSDPVFVLSSFLMQAVLLSPVTYFLLLWSRRRRTTAGPTG